MYAGFILFLSFVKAGVGAGLPERGADDPASRTARRETRSLAILVAFSAGAGIAYWFLYSNRLKPEAPTDERLCSA